MQYKKRQSVEHIPPPNATTCDYLFSLTFTRWQLRIAYGAYGRYAIHRSHLVNVDKISNVSNPVTDKKTDI